MHPIKALVKMLPPFRTLSRYLNAQYDRDEFVRGELNKLHANSTILDAGCGRQRYRQHCAQLVYRAQDFGQYTTAEREIIGSEIGERRARYDYGELDYVGDVWKIDESDAAFDAILCTEVLEHIPYPNETIKEFSRLLKREGRLILTAPSNCLRHMDPYFFYSGFSDRWYEKILQDNGLRIESMQPVGDYFRWLAVEIARTARSHSIFAMLALAPAFVYYYSKRKTNRSVDTLCIGYHIIATRT